MLKDVRKFSLVVFDEVQKSTIYFLYEYPGCLEWVEDTHRTAWGLVLKVYEIACSGYSSRQLYTRIYNRDNGIPYELPPNAHSEEDMLFMLNELLDMFLNPRMCK